MINDRLIKSFYRTYKELHKKLEEFMEEENKEWISARILDKVIIFLFIYENLINKDEKKYINKEIIESKNIYSKLMEFYNRPENFVKEKSNIISSITKLFEKGEYDELKSINDHLMENIFKRLLKFKWRFSNNNYEVITPDLLGKVFEKYINQRDTGAYYTEIDTIKYINNNSIILAFLSQNKIKVLAENDKYKCANLEESIRDNNNLFDVFHEFINSIDSIEVLEEIKKEINNFTIADITVGTAAFLLDAIDCIERMYNIIDSKLKSLNKVDTISKIDLLIKIIENNIYGVDIMDDAVEMAKFRVYLKVINLCIKEDCDIKCDIKINIKVGNTLIGNIKDSDENNQEYVRRFDWNNEFKKVIERGGFNCIIGNPPYIEYSKVREKYIVKNFESLKCGNIYAFVIERALNLLNQEGVLGLIVPISLVSTKRMVHIRNILEKECDVIFYSNYGDRPGTLFNGVHQKLTIVIGKRSENKPVKIYTSQYYHWYNEERVNIFDNIRYILNEYKNDDFYYKIGSSIQKDIIEKINKKNENLNYMTKKNKSLKNSVFLGTRLTFWVKSFINQKRSNEFKELYFNSEDEALVFNAIINSSLYYFWWETVSDCWHLTNKELELFKFDYDTLNQEQKETLHRLSDKLEISLEANKKYIGSKQTEYEYKHKLSKIIIDEIDKVLAQYYELTEEEYKYVIDYNLSYRMNDELEKYLSLRAQKGGM
ncbi:Eco57I restriction-modification methylase domain-containing protein [Clostridium baratii]|uniref:Eco57I restriction-modification methylase domain-containing protein n=1 Tax=Clostridium baratii TaxID=1561 RepID=UPI003D7A5188